MKLIKYILPAIMVSVFMAACDTDVENTDVIDPYTYSPLYYQNLRDYKNSDHAISWAWFADYMNPDGAMATRFLGLPDSLDIVSLWGGIPNDDSTRASGTYAPDVAKEMRFVQQTKGMKLVVPTIIRIRTRPEFYDSIWVAKNDPDSALILYARSLLRPIFENDLDGIDLDYEPEGDPLQGDRMTFFVKYLGKFVGPMANDSNVYVYSDGYTIKGDSTMLLCVDGYAPPKECEPYMNYWVLQAYGRGGGENPNNFAWEKCVYTENIGDYWTSNCGHILQQAAWQPPTGRKGGFGGFLVHRDYIHTSATWQGQTYNFSNYAHLRLGIQIQNPAIH